MRYDRQPSCANAAVIQGGTEASADADKELSTDSPWLAE